MSDTPNFDTQTLNKPKIAVVPTGVTAGLGLFAFLLSIAGYVLRLLVESDKLAVLLHALKVVPVFMIVIPSLCCFWAYVMNRFGDTNIHFKNAWTLGWLLSAVAMLSLMGQYS